MGSLLKIPFWEMIYGSSSRESHEVAYSNRALINLADDPAAYNSAALSKLGCPLFDTVFILKEILYLDSMLSLYVFWLTAFPFIWGNCPNPSIFMVDCEKTNAFETIIIPEW